MLLTILHRPSCFCKLLLGSLQPNSEEFYQVPRNFSIAKIKCWFDLILLLNTYFLLHYFEISISFVFFNSFHQQQQSVALFILLSQCLHEMNTGTLMGQKLTNTF